MRKVKMLRLQDKLAWSGEKFGYHISIQEQFDWLFMMNNISLVDFRVESVSYEQEVSTTAWVIYTGDITAEFDYSTYKVEQDHTAPPQGNYSDGLAF